MTAKAWVGTTGRLWGAAFQWTPGGAPTVTDDSTVTGPATIYGTVAYAFETFQTITGPGTAAALTFIGNTALTGSFDAGAVLVGTAVSAPGGLQLNAGTVFNAASLNEVFGTVRVNEARLPVAGTITLHDSFPVTYGSLTVENGGAVQADALVMGTTFESLYNYAGTVFVQSGATLELGAAGGVAPGTLQIDASHTLSGTGLVSADHLLNNGLIIAQPGFIFDGPITGAGTIQIGPGASLAVTTDTNPISFADAAGTLLLNAPSFGPLPSTPFGVIQRVCAGRHHGITRSGSPASGITGVTYRPGPNGLGTLTLSHGTDAVSTLTLAGDYTGETFSLKPNTSYATAIQVVPAAPIPTAAFQFTDGPTSGAMPGDTYTGPVPGLDRQYLWTGTDGVALASTVPNVFMKGGTGDDALRAYAGSNVLDGGAGSNFLVGTSGADGGQDTFFIDERQGAVTWSTVAAFHRGDAVTFFGFVAGLSTEPWTALDGATGYQGATIHSELGGAGTGIDGSVTFAGISLADALAKFTSTTGTVDGTPYLRIVFTG